MTPAVALHVLLELLDHLRGERAGDDPAEPGVPRVVHVDHRAEVLVELHRQVDRCSSPRRRTRTAAGSCWPRPRRRAGAGRSSRVPRCRTATLPPRRTAATPAPAASGRRHSAAPGGCAQNSLCRQVEVAAPGLRVGHGRTAFRTALSAFPILHVERRGKGERKSDHRPGRQRSASKWPLEGSRARRRRARGPWSRRRTGRVPRRVGKTAVPGDHDQDRRTPARRSPVADRVDAARPGRTGRPAAAAAG